MLSPQAAVHGARDSHLGPTSRPFLGSPCRRLLERQEFPAARPLEPGSLWMPMLRPGSQLLEAPKLQAGPFHTAWGPVANLGPASRIHLCPPPRVPLDLALRSQGAIPGSGSPHLAGKRPRGGDQDSGVPRSTELCPRWGLRTLDLGVEKDRDTQVSRSSVPAMVSGPRLSYLHPLAVRGTDTRHFLCLRPRLGPGTPLALLWGQQVVTDWGGPARTPTPAPDSTPGQRMLLLPTPESPNPRGKNA